MSMFDRQATLPIDVDLERQLLSLPKGNKEIYDKKHCKPGQIQCNQLVLLKNFDP